MVHIKIRDGEPFEKSFKRFTKTFEKSGTLAEVRKRERFEKPTAKKRRKKMEAARKQKKIEKIRIGLI